MYEFALIANIIIGIINFNRASSQYKQGEWKKGDLSFCCGIANTMFGMGMVAYGVFRILAA